MPTIIDDALPFLEGGPSDTSIGDIAVRFSEGEARISWTSTEPIGRRFQVYVFRRLVWSGTATQCSIPSPTHDRPIPVDIVAVSEEDALTDISSSLDPIAWGGSCLSISFFADPHGVEKFNVYLGDSPGAAVNYAAPIGQVSASPGGVAQNGFGRGGFGGGGFGFGDASYAWRNGPYMPGEWFVGVKPQGFGGLEGTAWESSVTIEGPPSPPPIMSSNKRLDGSYDVGTRVVTLTWEAST